MVDDQDPEQPANLLHFNLHVLSRETTGKPKLLSKAKGYTLADTGASHKFVRPAFLEKLTNENIKFTSRRYGTMRLTTAGNIETLPRHQAKLTLAMGNPHGTCFWYTGWFTIYDLVNYDIILGKDWHEQVKHTIDHKQNILTITKDMSCRPGRDVSLRGLARDQRAEEVELFTVVETAYGVIDREPNKNPWNPPTVTACRDLHSGKRTQVVSKATRQLAALPPAADASTISELFATSISNQIANNQTTSNQIANNQTAMDAKIRAEYRELFKEPTGLPPRRPRFGDFKIRLLPGSVAPYRAPYRLTPAEWEEYKRQIRLYSEKGHIRRSQSPYGAPVLFVPKQGGAPGELQMVIDYRALNAITIKDRFPLPLPEELIDKLHNKKFFSKMDFWSGYSQGRVATQDIEKTAFIGPDGLWEWLVVPQGIATAPAWFMRMVSELLAKHIKAGYCVVFIDDILIFSDSQQDHDQHVRAVLDTLRSEGFRLKEKKCEFGRAETEFVGFVVNGRGLRLMENKTRAIKDWPMVRSPKDIRSFLGLAGAYRKFVPKFAIHAMPLFNLLNVKQKDFDDHMAVGANRQKVHRAMKSLKDILTSAPYLAIPDPANHEYLVRTDASDFGIGATLR